MMMMSEEQRQNQLNMQKTIMHQQQHHHQQQHFEEEPLYATVIKKHQREHNYLSADVKSHIMLRQLGQLENYYGGREIAHWAAIIIQRAFRSFKLRNKFQRLKNLNTNKSFYKNSSENGFENIDQLILQAAGLNLNGKPQKDVTVVRPSARRIRRPSNRNVRRSMSLKDTNRAKKELAELRSRDDLELPPPPPHLLYDEEDPYSVMYDQNMKTSISTPRPPQRTVSFLAGSTLPRKMSAINQMQHQTSPQPNHQYSNSQPVHNICDQHYIVQSRNDEDSLHNRSYSSPSMNYPGQPDKPLPPPYIPPPNNRSESPLPPPPPPESDEIIINEDLPLPPPPPPITTDIIQTPRLLAPHNCGGSTSSSVSSIDSGFPYDHRGPSSPIRHSPDTQSWVSSPNFIVSPDSVQQVRDSVFEVSRNQGTPSPVTRNTNNVDTSLDTSYCDIYGRISKNGNYQHNLFQQQQQRVKKQVRIQTPSIIQQQQVIVVDDTTRKRQYRVGLNLFNQNPERGMEYLLKKNFVEYSPAAVAKFLLGRKGLSKKIIGEYLTSLQRPFNMATLHCFIHEIDFSGLHLDIALRQLQQEVTLPGEAQKIEKMIEVFSKRYIQCNTMFVAGFKSPDTIFVLAYAMVLLNTDLHSPAVRTSRMRQMKREDFIRNLRGVDAGQDLDTEMLQGIYDRIRNNEFRPGPDHHSQVSRVEENIKGNYDKSIGGRLAEPHRRLVCFCRLTEVIDPHKKEKAGAHQRGVFLFNDLLVVTKTINKKKTGSIHQYRYSIPLRDIKVTVFSSTYHPYGITIQDKFSGRDLASFNAKSETDQQRFVNDLQESAAETVEMEKARLFIEEAEAML